MSLTPYLLYEDVAGATEFLSKAFGFTMEGEPYRERDGRINHASMKAGDDLIMMGWPGKQYRNPKRLGQATVLIYVMVKDVDKHCERARKAGAVILKEPEDQFYGHRRYGAADPEGHEWYFGEEIKKAPAKKKPARKRWRPAIL